jgi:hypothetical protein
MILVNQIVEMEKEMNEKSVILRISLRMVGDLTDAQIHVNR